MAGVWVERTRDGRLGTRGRVPPVRGDAPAALPEDAGGAGTSAGGDDRRPSGRGRRPLPLVPAPGPAAAPSPAPTAIDSPPPRRTLPTPSTSLVGPEDDIAEVSSLVESPDVRLVTLTGPGGIGNHRRGIAVGAALAETGYRTEFVSLASITDPAQVLPRVAAAVGAPIEGTRSALDTLIEHFAQS